MFVSDLMPEQTKTVVLVVEDEPLILMDAMQTFEDAGFDVIDAFNVDHALVRLDERPDISAVFTDVDMPGRFNGVELARMVHDRRPDAVIIVTSGAVAVRRDDLPERSQFIPKPYRGEKVASLIAELLA
ncbi:response regulator [Croceibacterium ferulae]|uniref:response regulator n=1 Tax=Croceibacterium ferulae TaxID=1854641 RepID=UPI0019D497ED|nr:response regulator [Croceibacterium ferulae]